LGISSQPPRSSANFINPLLLPPADEANGLHWASAKWCNLIKLDIMRFTGLSAAVPDRRSLSAVLDPPNDFSELLFGQRPTILRQVADHGLDPGDRLLLPYPA
jgi:hypothetical protein